MVFNREKVIDFTGDKNPFPFDQKHIGINIKALNKQGEKILKQSAKFWIVYILLLPEKVIQFNQEQLHEDLNKLFKGQDYQLICSELGQILNFKSVKTPSGSGDGKENINSQ